MIFRFLLALIPVFVLTCMTGCYDRWTGNYDEIPELNSDDGESAVLEVSETSEKEDAERRESLKKMLSGNELIYTIGGGDKIEVIVYNHSDLSFKTTVTPDGYIGMVLLGQINIAGLTLGQASEKIEKELSKYIRNPKVGISPYEIVSETVTICGAVTHPGIYPISKGMRLSDLFAKAGGAASRHYEGQSLSAADFSNSLFIRNRQNIPVDFSQAIEKGDPLYNLILRPGDYIFISAREDCMVYLIGDVKKPGRHIWSQSLGLLELLSAGGWLNETYWHHAIIIRGGLSHPKMYKVDLDGIIRGTRRNIPIKSGDIVYIPKDNISEYNVFVRKLLPTAQLINMMITPGTWISSSI